MEILQIPPQDLNPDPNNPRKTICLPKKINELRQSIKKQGIINPIEIDKSNTIVTGHLRVIAAMLAGLETVPCKVIDVKNGERLERQMIENLQRDSMNAMDVARGLQKLLNPGLSKKHNDEGYSELARKLGVSELFVRERIDLLKEKKSFQKAVEQEKIKATMIRAVKAAPDEHKDAVREKIMKGELKTRDGALKVAQRLKERPDKATEILNSDYSGMDSGKVHEYLQNTAPTELETENIDKDYFKRVRNQCEALERLLDRNPFAEIKSGKILPMMGKKIALNAVKDLQEKLKSWASQANKIKELTGAVIDV